MSLGPSSKLIVRSSTYSPYLCKSYILVTSNHSNRRPHYPFPVSIEDVTKHAVQLEKYKDNFLLTLKMSLCYTMKALLGRIHIHRMKPSNLNPLRSSNCAVCILYVCCQQPPFRNFSLPIRPWLHVYFRNTQFIFQDAFYRHYSGIYEFHVISLSRKKVMLCIFSYNTYNIRESITLHAYGMTGKRKKICWN